MLRALTKDSFLIKSFPIGASGLFLAGWLSAAELSFTAIQPEIFSDPFAQSNAWGDFDNDNDLDLAVVFLNEPMRLYENRDGEFVDVAADLGLSLIHI